MAKGKKTGGKGKKKSSGRRKLIKRLKSDASVFLSSEEGKIVKKDIVKTAIALGLVASSAAFNSAEAGHTNSGGAPHADQPATNTPHGDAVTHILHNDGALSGHSSGAHSDAIHVNVPHSDSPATPHTDAWHSNGGWC